MKKNRSFFLYKIIISSILFRSTTNVARDESKWLELVGTSCWMLLVAAKTKNLQNFNLSFEKGLTLKQKVGHYHVQNWKFSRLEEHRWFFCSIRNLDFRCIWFLSLSHMRDNSKISGATVQTCKLVIKIVGGCVENCRVLTNTVHKINLL